MNTSLCSLHYRVGDQLKTTKMKKKNKLFLIMSIFLTQKFLIGLMLPSKHSGICTDLRAVLSKLRIL